MRYMLMVFDVYDNMCWKPPIHQDELLFACLCRVEGRVDLENQCVTFVCPRRAVSIDSISSRFWLWSDFLKTPLIRFVGMQYDIVIPLLLPAHDFWSQWLTFTGSLNFLEQEGEMWWSSSSSCVMTLRKNRIRKFYGYSGLPAAAG